MTGIGNIQLAWRNLWRNRRRSAATILSLAFGFAAVALFAGYTSAVYVALSNAAIHAELIGHLTINRQGWQTEGKLHPDKYLLTAGETITGLRDAASAAHWPQASELAHKLKSSSRSVGAMRLGALCEALEREGRAGSPGTCQALVALVIQGFSEVETRIRSRAG
jgi:hypothetical protein